MGLTRNGLRIGMAAHTQKREEREWLEQMIEKERKRKQAQLMDICQEVRDCMTQAEYDAWWASTPDGENEFYEAAEAKLLEIKSESAHIADADAHAEEQVGTSALQSYHSPEHYAAMRFADTFDFDRVVEIPY